MGFCWKVWCMLGVGSGLKAKTEGLMMKAPYLRAPLLPVQGNHVGAGYSWGPEF